MPAARRWIFGSLVPCLLAFYATAYPQLLEVPNPASPPDQATDIPLTLVIQWHPTASASGYDLQVSASPNFGTLIVDESALSDTFRQETMPANGKQYYWRVRGEYVLLTSQWSQFQTFTTIAATPPAPALIAPPDGATSLPTTLKLLWHASMTEALYRVQVSRDTTFSTIVQDQDNISDTSYLAASLAFSSKFFWRVLAKNGDQTSTWSDTWRFSTGEDVPDAPSLVAPANGALDQPLTMTFRWSAGSAASSFHLQLSTDSLFTSTPVVDTQLTAYSLQAGGLANQTSYFWRVQGKNSAGAGPWSGVWKLTTIPAPPPAPTLAAPTDHSTGQPVSLSLRWNASARASAYALEVSVDPSFTSTAVDTPITQLSYLAGPLSYNTTYFWRVLAVNNGGTSAWSNVWSFTTNPASTSGPVLLSPPNGAVNQPTSPVLAWQALSGTSEYHLQLSADPTFGQRLMDDSTLTATSQRLSSLTNYVTYYWRVRGRFVASYGDWSDTWAFTTIPLPPAAPSLATPANGATNVATSPVLTWNAPAGASRYHLQVSTSSSFTTTVAEDSTLTATAMQLGALAANTTFYWRVSASNAGGTSNWSTAWNFTTQPVSTSGPVLLSPANSAVNQSTSPVLTWQALTGASRYQLQVSADPAFGQRLFDDSTLTGTSQTLASLTNSTTYYWRVRGRFVASYSDWSTVWAFSTIALPPAAPSLATPANGATNVATSPALTWNASSGASRYHVQVSTASSFTTIVAEDSTLTATAKQLGGLAANATFYWRVSASNAGGTSGWSSVWHFTTIPDVPDVPALLSPADGATDQPVSLGLSWNSVTGAAWYHAQISLNPGFTLLEADQDSIFGQSFTATSLTRGSIHYWRVSAANQGGVGGWSVIRSFTTVPDPPPPPILSAPIERATDRPISLVLAWYPSAGAAAYRVQLASDSTFSARTVDDSNVVGTSKPVQGLSYNTPYTWRVRGKNSGGAGNWSQTGHFSTQPSGTQSGPSLASPADGSNNMPSTVLMSWNALASATVYELQVSDRSDFSTSFYDNSTLTSTSQSVGSLSASTTYYWRVRGAIVALWSDWSTVWTFSTIPAVPPPPALTSPADGASDQPRNITLSWNAISGATLYHLQCATNSQFTSLVADDSSLTSASRTVGPLALNTDYYWQVRAKNAGGWGSFSTSRTFRTTQGLSPVVSTDQATAVTESTATIHATVNPNGLSTTVKFQYGTTMSYGGSVDAVPSTVTGASAVGVYYNLAGLNAGTTYHYRAVATSSAGVANGSDMTITTRSAAYPATVDVALSLGFPMHQNPSDYAAADYRLVGLPGAGGAEMSTFMQGAGGTDWQMYWDNGAPEGGLVKYDGGSNFTALSGRGYWLINKGAWSLQTSLAAAPIDSQRMGAIALHAGWNLITDPFTTPRAWGSVQQLNGVTEPLYAFHAGFGLSDTLNPYEGYYFFNATGLAQLKIPYDVQAIVAGKAGRRIEGGWALGIGAESRDGRDTGSEIGILADAGTAIPSRRYHKPRSFRTIPQVYFSRPEWDPVFSTFATDFRYSMQDALSWEMDVAAPSGVPVTLSFSGVAAIPSQYGVYLIDDGGHHVVDVRQSASYSFSPRSGTTHLTLLVGTAEATRDRLSAVTRATAFSLGHNYPNPFNPATTIPVEIPERSFVEVKVYDILGQEIRTLYSGELDQGTSAFVWDGKDLRGSAAPSGIYFCRLTTGSGFSTVQKMTLSK